MNRDHGQQPDFVPQQGAQHSASYPGNPAATNIPASVLHLLEAAFAQDPRPAGIPDEVWSAMANEIQDAPDQPDGLPETRDLYALWSAVTTSVQEVKLQGRAFKDLVTSLNSLGNVEQAMARMTELHQQALDNARANASQAARMGQALEQRQIAELRSSIEDEILEVFLDIHERLCRGLGVIEEQMRQTREMLLGSFDACKEQTGISPLLARLESALARKERLPVAVAQLLADVTPLLRSVRWVRLADKQARGLADSLKSLEQGYRINLARLEDVLHGMNVEVIPALGQPFDPISMRVVELADNTGKEEGTVLAVLRNGYRRGDDVIRPCEVMVARGERKN